MKKNICYLVSSLVRCGPSNQLSYILKYLDKTKYNPIILTLFEEDKNTLKTHFEQDLNVKVLCLKMKRIDVFLQKPKKINEILKLHKIDIIQTQGVLADYISFKKITLDIKKISTIRNYPYHDYPSIFGKHVGYYVAKKHISIIKKNSENFIACSKTIMEIFNKELNIKLKYIQNGVDIEKYHPSNNVIDLKKKLNLSENEKIYISLGSLIPRKDFTTMINGFKEFNSNKNNLLLIAGNGFERKQLESISSNRIIFLGNIDNAVEYLQVSDCFISTSLSEGLPNSVLEAMACALPCILSNIPSHRELVENELDGIFFEKKNHKDLSNKLLKTVNNLKNHSEISLNTIINNHTAQKMSKGYQKLYS